MKDQSYYDVWQGYKKHRTDERSFNLTDYETVNHGSPGLTVETIQVDTFVKRVEKIKEDETKNEISKEEKKTQINKESRHVFEYENWEGRIVALEHDTIGAYIVNTLNHYSKRFVRIEKKFFIDKGITEELSYGDKFELSYQTIRNGKGPIKNNESIRMIHHVKKSKAEIDAYVDEQMRVLDFIFE